MDSALLAKLRHLDAVINETLRLLFPWPSGFQSSIPPEGLLVGDTFIPRNTNDQVSIYSVFRDERNLKQPNEFIPERWITRTDLVTESSRASFMPFFSGSLGCPGRLMALAQIRYLVAAVFS